MSLPEGRLDVTVEPGSPEDYEAIVDVLTRARDHQVTMGQPPAWTVIPCDAIRSDLEQGVSVVLRRRGDRGLVGAASLHADDREVWARAPSDALYLHRLAVLPAEQGQGFGGAIIDWAEQRALDESRTFLRIDVVAENLALQEWYERRGYEAKGTIKPPSYRRPTTLFEKRLLG